jgi:hypothetical protein
MAGIGKFKLSDAVKPPTDKIGSKKGGKPKPSHGTAAEQSREASEAKSARNAGVSNRDRMVDIGRGGKQAGRQGSA